MSTINLPTSLTKLYLSLKIQDKQLWEKYGYYINTKKDAQYLRILASNLIPHGHLRLAERLLKIALDLNPDNLEKAWIYANLYQTATDSSEYSLASQYCRKVIETGYLVAWARATLTEPD